MDARFRSMGEEVQKTGLAETHRNLEAAHR